MNIVTKLQFAGLINRSKTRVHQLVREGMPQRRDGRIEVEAAKEWLEANHDDYKISETDVGGEETLYAIQKRKEFAIANIREFESRIKELELAEKRRELISVTVVDAWQEPILAAFRARALAVPVRAAPLCAASSSTEECRAIIESFIHECLTELSTGDFLGRRTNGKDHQAQSDYPSPAANVENKRVGRPRKKTIV